MSARVSTLVHARLIFLPSFSQRSEQSLTDGLTGPLRRGGRLGGRSARLKLSSLDSIIGDGANSELERSPRPTASLKERWVLTVHFFSNGIDRGIHPIHWVKGIRTEQFCAYGTKEVLIPELVQTNFCTTS